MVDWALKINYLSIYNYYYYYYYYSKSNQSVCGDYFCTSGVVAHPVSGTLPIEPAASQAPASAEFFPPCCVVCMHHAVPPLHVARSGERREGRLAWSVVGASPALVSKRSNFIGFATVICTQRCAEAARGDGVSELGPSASGIGCRSIVPAECDCSV